MNKLLKKILLLVLLCGTVSCDDFLTQDNPNYRDVNEYWENISNIERGLNAAYATLRNRAIYNTREEAFRSDLAWPGAGRPIPKSQGEEYVCYTHTYNNATSFIEDKWEACYTGIFRANQVIRALNKVKDKFKDNLEHWSILMGQARFLRGLFHFYLHSAYNNGKIIIVDEIPYKLEDFHLPLSESSEVVAFFRKDLVYAFENLPVKYENANENLGRITSGVAATVLGTSYLYEYSDNKRQKVNMEKNDEILRTAVRYFNYVINDCEYELVQDPDVLFNEKYEFNNESIFEIVYTDLVRPEINEWDSNSFIQKTAFYTTQYYGGHYLPAWLANAYQTEKVDEKDDRNYCESENDETLDNKELRKISLRASSMVALWLDVYSPWYGAENVPARNKNFSFSDCGFGYYKKFSDCKSYKDDRTKSGMNIVITRLSEVYLMYAECMIEQNNIPEALKYINLIRKRWGLVLLGPAMDKDNTYDELPYNQSTLLKRLQYVEKPLEVSIEGHMTRWIDLRRWGLLEERFKELSEAKYFAVNEQIVAPNKKTYVMNSYGIVKNEAEMKLAPKDNKLIDFEYDMAYKNFDYTRHAYYPIPMNEIERNPNLYK